MATTIYQSIKLAMVSLFKGKYPAYDVFCEEIAKTQNDEPEPDLEDYIFLDIIPAGSATVDAEHTDRRVLVDASIHTRSESNADYLTISQEVDDLIRFNKTSRAYYNLVDGEADRILGKILSPSMSQWEQARAIYNYVHTHVKYVGYSDKSSWLMGAYVGFTRGRGDCYNYFACSKALLDKAGIPNVDLYRVGGGTDHYWQLVNVGNGWYHFDACPHPDSYPLNSFLLDEMAVRAYPEKCAPVRTNYYVYDYANCPVIPVGTPIEELPAESEPVETETVETPSAGDPNGTEVLLPPGVLEQISPSPEPPAELTPPPGPELTGEPTEEPSSGLTHPPENPPPAEETPVPSASVPDAIPSAESPAVESDISGKEDLT